VAECKDSECCWSKTASLCCGSKDSALAGGTAREVHVTRNVLHNQKCQFNNVTFLITSLNKQNRTRGRKTYKDTVACPCWERNKIHYKNFRNTKFAIVFAAESAVFTFSLQRNLPQVHDLYCQIWASNVVCNCYVGHGRNFQIRYTENSELLRNRINRSNFLQGVYLEPQKILCKLVPQKKWQHDYNKNYRTDVEAKGSANKWQEFD
jgi:hypothetical protein